MREFLAKRWFLIALFCVLAIGISYAQQLQPLSELKFLRNCVVATVLILMALPLEAGEMRRALSGPGPPLLGVFVNLGLVPLLAWPVSFGLRGDLGPGLLVAAATPSTLASASVWTRRAGGNDAVSLLITIITNSICFFVTPLWLVVMTGQTVDSPELSFNRMTVKLGLLVVLPMLLAQLMRLYRPVGSWATAHKISLGAAAQCGMLVMVSLGAIRTGLRIRADSAQALLVTDLLSVLAAVLAVHLVTFWLGVWLSKLCGFSREDRIAIGFGGSQKTLVVGLLVAVSLQVSILPIVVYHISQLLVDTLIVDLYRKGARRGSPALPDAE